MKKFPYVFILSTIFLNLFSNPVIAQKKSTQEDYQWQGMLSLKDDNFEFTELHTDGSRDVSESGFLSGLKGQLIYSNDDHYFIGELSFLQSYVNYDGKARLNVNGSTIRTPFVTDTDTRIINASLSAGDVVFRKDNFSYDIAMGLGYRYWERDVQGLGLILGAYEESNWFYFLLNNTVNLKVNSKNTVSVNFMYRDFISATTTSDPVIDRVVTNVKYDLNGGRSYQLGAKLNHNVKEGLDLVAGFTDDRWNFERTISNQHARAQQPKNKTRQLSVFFGATMAF